MTGFFQRLMANVLGDADQPDADRPDIGVPMLAHWLPYRSYYPKTGIFYNSASRGFVLEVPAKVMPRRHERHRSRIWPCPRQLVLSQGLMTLRPAASNGLVSRVATANPCAAAIAAI